MQVKILRWIDKYVYGFFGLTFFWLKYIFGNRTQYIKNPQKILIIRVRALGSSLLTLPMIKQLRDYYGNDIKLDLLASNRNQIVYENQGHFSKIYNLFSFKDLLRLIFSFKKYDIVVDTEEYFRITALLSVWLGKISIGFGEIFTRRLCYNFSIKYEKNHQVIEYLKLLIPLGIKYKVPKKLESMKYMKQDKLEVERFLKQYDGKIRICMHTSGAETSPDRFRSIGKWKKLIEEIIDNYGDKVNIFLSGSRSERDKIDFLISTLNKKYQKQVSPLILHLHKFACFLKNCDLMISNDTGPMHLSACMGTKTLGLFGPNLPTLFGAWPLDKNVNIYKGNGKIYIKVMEGIFDEDKERNVDKIEVNDVLEGIKQLLGK